eukprot:g530.t1
MPKRNKKRRFGKNARELDMDCVKSFSESLCRGGNYDFKYKRRTGEDKADGLCMFWNKSRWTRVHYVDVEFYRYDEDPLMDRHNVAQICVLKELSSGNMILIANTHLLFNPKRGDVKIRQLEILLKEISNVREKFDRSDNKFCVLLMGDFNAVPGSAMYELLSKGRLSLRNLDRKLISGQWNPKTMHEWKEIKWTFDTRHLGRGTCMRVFRSEKRTGDTKPRSCDGIDVDVEKEDKKNFLKHELSLHSAYSESATTKSTGEPAFTTYHSRFKGTVDYIWYGKGLNRLKVLEMIPKTILDRFSGLPSAKWSSDHMSLCAEFEFSSSSSLSSSSVKTQEDIKLVAWPSL